MSAIQLAKFSGEIPRLEANALDIQHAQKAENVKLTSDGMRGYMQEFLAFTPQRLAVRSFFRIVQAGVEYWLTSANDVNWAPAAIANDTLNRVYYTGEATPRKTSYILATNTGGTTECPFDYLELGVPAPTAAAALAVIGGAGATTTRSYVYTFLTSWGEESKPSPLVTVTGFVSGSWNLSSMQTTIAGKYSVTKQRIYRTLTDSFGNTNYQLVVEQNVAATYNDTIADTALGAIITTVAYDTPPTDLSNLITLPNGVLAGFSASSKQVCFCEPYQPHAWPNAYRYAVEYTPVGIGAVQNAVLVATLGSPYIMSGTHPSNMTSVKLPMQEICASKRSVVDVGYGVMYASYNGFVLASQAGADRVSDVFFSRNEWVALNPSSMMFIKYDEKIFIFYKKVDNTYGGYSLDKEKNALARLNVVVDAVYVDRINGNFYLLQNNQIKQWDADPFVALPYTWKSKRIILPRPVNMGCAQVDADFDDIASTATEAAAYAAQLALNVSLFASGVKGCFNDFMFNDSVSGVTPAPGFLWNGSSMFGVAVPVTDKYVTFRLYAEGALRYTKNVTNRDVFRLPSGYRSDAIEVEINATVATRYIKLAETAKEIQRL